MLMCQAWLLGAVALVTQSAGLPLAYWQHSSWTGDRAPPVAGEHYMVHSPDGYLWLSTYSGLLRFDGVRFTVFDSTSVPAFKDVGPGALGPQMVDRHGTMWVSGPRGSYFTYRDGVFHRATEAPGGVLWTEDEQGLIFVVRDTIVRFDGHRSFPVPLPSALAHVRPWSAMTDRNGGFWIGTQRAGLWHVDRDGQVTHHGSGAMRPAFLQRDGTLLVQLINAGASLARLVEDRLITLRLADGSIVPAGTVAAEDADGWAWIQSGNRGVFRYRAGRTESFSTQNGLSSDRIDDVEPDPSGAVWVSTEAGLDRLRPAPFTPLRPPAPWQGAPMPAYPDSAGGAWMSTADSRQLHLMHGGFLDVAGGPVRDRLVLTVPTLLRILAPSPHGGVWVWVTGGMVYRIRSDGSREPLRLPPSFRNAQLNSLLETEDSTIWLEPFRGFGSIRHGSFRKAPIAGIDTSHPHSIIESGPGRLLVSWGTESMLWLITRDSVIERIMLPGKEPAQEMARQGGDTLWLLTRTRLYRMIGRQISEVRSRDLEAIFAPNHALALARGTLWVSSHLGIANASLAALNRRADGDTSPVLVRRFDVIDGLPMRGAARRLTGTVVRGPEDRVWINTAAGPAIEVSASDTRSMRGTTPRIEDAAADLHPIGDDGQIAPGPGRVEIHFTATGVDAPELARLQYRMEGVDPDWIEGTIPRVAIYNHLRPGDYTFRVRAWDRLGTPGASEAARAFTVRPAWFQRRWFLGLVVVLIAAAGALLALGIQRRRHRIAERVLRREYEATLAERARIAQDLHDTLLQGFAGVTLQLKAAELALPEKPEVAIETIVRSQQLARESLREARERVWEMKEVESRTEDLAAVLERLARDRVAGTDIEVRLTVSGDRRRLPPPVEDAAFRIGREAIVNAVRHAGATRLTLEVDFGAASLELRVMDDGRGLTSADTARARSNGHFGMTGMQQRAEQVGGQCMVQSAPGEGTTISLQVPITPPA